MLFISNADWVRPWVTDVDAEEILKCIFNFSFGFSEAVINSWRPVDAADRTLVWRRAPFYWCRFERAIFVRATGLRWSYLRAPMELMMVLWKCYGFQRCILRDECWSLSLALWPDGGSEPWDLPEIEMEGQLLYRSKLKGYSGHLPLLFEWLFVIHRLSWRPTADFEVEHAIWRHSKGWLDALRQFWLFDWAVWKKTKGLSPASCNTSA